MYNITKPKLPAALLKAHALATYVGPRFCDVTRGLLQRHSRWASKSTTDNQRYPEVRPRAHPPPALAGRSSAGAVQAVHRCLQHKATQYMTDCCIHTSVIARRQHQRSASCHQLFVPIQRRSMFGRREFSVAGPAAWDSLPDYLRHPSRPFNSFRQDMKTLFTAYTEHQRLCDYAQYKSAINIDIDSDGIDITRN